MKKKNCYSHSLLKASINQPCIAKLYLLPQPHIMIPHFIGKLILCFIVLIFSGIFPDPMMANGVNQWLGMVQKTTTL